MVSMTKKIGALAMAVVMTCALAITASAVDYTNIPTSGDVDVYKDGSTSDKSMADKAFTTYDASATDSIVTVMMPLKVIERATLYGYITDSTTASVNGTAVTAYVEGEDSDGYYSDDGAYLVLEIPTSAFLDTTGLVSKVVVDIHFGIKLSSSTHLIQTSMSTDADLYLYVNPTTASAS